MKTTSYGLDAVNIGYLKQGKDGVPLMISPRWDASLDFLVKWCQENRTMLDEMLLKSGAVLVRGFDISTAHEMEMAVKAYQPTLNDTYRGTSPRKLMQGTDFVFSAAEVPANYPIAQHLEMSFLDAPPRQLFFGCLQPSKSAGGETALADFRKVYADLSPELKQKFLDKGVLYTRTHHKKGTYFTYDVADMLGWPALFGTDDKQEVEKLCAAEGIPVTWTDDDTFVSTTHQQAFQLHPVTKEPVWFNHTQVFHWTTFPSELWFAFQRNRDVRLLIHCIFVTIFCIVKYGLLRHKMALHCTFGDGSSISVTEMNEIRRAIHKNMVFTRWEKGDMIFLDNFSVSHGRQPTYDSGRKVVVAWADPLRKDNTVSSLEKQQQTCIAVEEREIAEAVCMENPQERTPQPSLTNKEAVNLKEDIKEGLHHNKTIHDTLRSLSNNPQDVHVSDKTLHILKNIVAQAEARTLHTRTHSQPAIVGCPDFWQNED